MEKGLKASPAAKIFAVHRANGNAKLAGIDFRQRGNVVCYCALSQRGTDFFNNFF